MKSKTLFMGLENMLEKESFYGLEEGARICEGPEAGYRPKPSEGPSVFSSKPLSSQTTQSRRRGREEYLLSFFLPIVVWLVSV